MAGEVSGASSTAPMAIKPKVTSSRAAPVMEVGLEEGIGMGTMEEEECRGRADNSPAAAPLQPKAPHPCPSRPANGGTDNRRKGFGLPHVKEQPAGEPQKDSQPHDTEWKNRRCTKTSRTNTSRRLSKS